MIHLGMSDAEFRASRFERGMLHQKAALRAPPPTWREIDALLHALDPHPPFLQLFHRGRLQDCQSYLDESSQFGFASLNRRRLYEFLVSGATVVLNRVESFMPFAALACQNLAERMRVPAMANAYLSLSRPSGGETTFGAHWDTHDVFALQLLGRKRWRVYEPTWTLPLSMQTSQRSGHSRPAVPVFDCVLVPGDLLYLPRGWWHEVEAFDQASFHLSVGLYPRSLHDYLQWAVARLLPEFVEVRRSIGLSAPADLQVATTALVTALLDPAHLAAFERENAGRRSASAFDLELLSGGAAPQDDDEVQLVPGVLHRGAGGETQVDARLMLDADRRAILSVLAKEGPLSVGALRGYLSSRSPDMVRAALMRLVFDDAIALRRR